MFEEPKTFEDCEIRSDYWDDMENDIDFQKEYKKWVESQENKSEERIAS